MKFVDRLRVTSTGTSAAVLTLGAAAAGCRTLPQAIADGASDPTAIKVGDTGVPFVTEDGVGGVEHSLFTITSATQITRESVLSSSNGGAAVTFSGAPLTVYNTPPASWLRNLPVTRDIPFSQSVPLTVAGHSYMPTQTVSGPLTFTPAAQAVRDALTYLRLVADGVNAPNFAAFKEWDGTAGYTNTAGLVNVVQFFHDGIDAWYTVAHAVSAATSTTTDTVLPAMVGSLASSNITTSGFTVTWQPGTDNVGIVAYEGSTNGGASFTPLGNVLTWTVSGLTAGTPYPTQIRAIDAAGNRASPALALTVTTTSSSDTVNPTMNGSITTSNVTQTGYALAWSAGSDNVGVAGYEYSLNGGASYIDAGNVLSVNVSGRTAGAVDQVRVRDYDAAGLRGTPLSASVTLSPATAPGAPTAVGVTPGDASVSVTGTAPASNGGSPITGYTATATPAAGGAAITASSATLPVVVPGLTNGVAYNVTLHANNAPAGAGPESSPAVSATPAAVDWPRLGQLSATTTESGSGPYIYTGGGTAFASEKGGLTLKSLPANTDGWLQYMVLNAPDSVEVGFRTLNTPQVYASQTTGFYTTPLTSGDTTVPKAYRHIGEGDIAGAVPAALDELRVGRFNTTTAPVFKMQLRRNGSSTWTDISTVGSAPTAQLWFDVVCAGASSVKLTGSSGLA